MVHPRKGFIQIQIQIQTQVKVKYKCKYKSEIHNPGAPFPPAGVHPPLPHPFHDSLHGFCLQNHLRHILHYFITVFSYPIHFDDDRIDTDTKVWDIMSAISLSQWSTTIGTPRLVG